MGLGVGEQIEAALLPLRQKIDDPLGEVCPRLPTLPSTPALHSTSTRRGADTPEIGPLG